MTPFTKHFLRQIRRWTTLAGVLAATVIPRPAAAQTQQWSLDFDNAKPAGAYGIASDSTGVYIVGETQGALPGQTAIGERDAYIRKYDPSGNELWTSEFGMTGVKTFVSGNGVAVDSSGVYVVGNVYSVFSGRREANSKTGAFVHKFDKDGNALWVYESPKLEESAVGVAVNASGVYVVGSTNEALPGTTAVGSSDIYVRKFDFDGNVQWVQEFGSPEFDIAYGVATDATGVYIVGYAGAAFTGQKLLGTGMDSSRNTTTAETRSGQVNSERLTPITRMP